MAIERERNGSEHLICGVEDLCRRVGQTKLHASAVINLVPAKLRRTQLLVVFKPHSYRYSYSRVCTLLLGLSKFVGGRTGKHRFEGELASQPVMVFATAGPMDACGAWIFAGDSPHQSDDPGASGSLGCF